MSYEQEDKSCPRSLSPSSEGQIASIYTGGGGERDPEGQVGSESLSLSPLLCIYYLRYRSSAIHCKTPTSLSGPTEPEEGTSECSSVICLCAVSGHCIQSPLNIKKVTIRTSSIRTTSITHLYNTECYFVASEEAEGKRERAKSSPVWKHAHSNCLQSQTFLHFPSPQFLLSLSLSVSVCVCDSLCSTLSNPIRIHEKGKKSGMHSSLPHLPERLGAHKDPIETPMNFRL